MNPIFSHAARGDANSLIRSLETTDICIRDLDGRTLLHYAVYAPTSNACVKAVCDNVDVNAIDKDGVTALHVAASCGNIEALRLLLERGAFVSAADKCLNTPLHCAARWGHADCARALLDAGAAIEFENVAGFTPLAKAAAHGQLDCVELLISREANKDAPSKRLWTPLHYACAFGRVVTTALLVDSGASMTAADKKGDTPLHVAAEVGSLDCMSVLADSGADVDAVNARGRTPLACALASTTLTVEQSRHVAGFLIAAGATVPSTVRLSQEDIRVAKTHVQSRIASLSGAAVKRAYRRMEEELDRLSCRQPHVALRILRSDGSYRDLVLAPFHTETTERDAVFTPLARGAHVTVHGAALVMALALVTRNVERRVALKNAIACSAGLVESVRLVLSPSREMLKFLSRAHSKLEAARGAAKAAAAAL